MTVTAFLLYPIRAAVIFFVTLALKWLTQIQLYAQATNRESIIYEFPNFTIELLCLAGTVFIFNTACRVAHRYMKEERDKYLKDRIHSDGFFEEMGDIIRSPDFVCEAVTVAFLSAWLALSGAFPEVAGSIGQSSRAASLLVIPLFLLIILVSKYEIRGYWLSLKLRGELHKLSGRVRMGFAIGVPVIMYPTVYPFVSYLVAALISFSSVFSELADALTVVGLILALIGVIFLFYGLSLLGAFSKRRKLLKNIAAAAEEAGYEMGPVHNPYMSFLRNYDEPSFMLFGDDGKRFVCKLIPTLRRGTHLYLISADEGYFRHRLGTKNHHITLNHHIRFSSGDTDGTRILIVNPIPKHIYAEENGDVIEVVSGDRLWGCCIYDGKSFVGNLSRRMLDRDNSDFD